MSEFDVYVTITGLNMFPNCRRLQEGEIITLISEPENPADKYAVAAYGSRGKIGYVANSSKTVRKDTFSATRLCEVLENSAKAIVVEGTYHDALCRVIDVFDVDKIILKAYEYYNVCEFEPALELFLSLCKKYNSVLLLQKTADCLIKLDRYAEALPYIKSALDAAPDDKTSMMMYAVSLEYTGKIQEAVKEYETILSLCDNEQVKLALERCKQKEI